MANLYRQLLREEGGKVNNHPEEVGGTQMLVRLLPCHPREHWPDHWPGLSPHPVPYPRTCSQTTSSVFRTPTKSLSDRTIFKELSGFSNEM